MLGIRLSQTQTLLTCSGNDATQEEFISLKNDSTTDDSFKEMSLPAYWSAMVASYFRVASTEIQLLMSFSSIWLWEACFLTILRIKNKARNKLIAELDQRCALSTTKPRIHKLVTKCNTSHLISAAVMMCTNLLSLSFNRVILQYLR